MLALARARVGTSVAVKTSDPGENKYDTLVLLRRPTLVEIRAILDWETDFPAESVCAQHLWYAAKPRSNAKRVPKKETTTVLRG